ncbi:SDR family oxidoreductase [Quadrisphaera setariae]|uniref:SDR family NAD(P)-dependent oxidoreductase n=1 Tax=Quadrisphaera setariae TaxID=2593304 RepID=A0A5C8ZK59_9ACTN|nr:SDR family NAD(P)-dependent oxidoreductase [Quadrisphaera setariae]TXR58004.1 SDR family NAD(P)-dependent oxidoreductase [Quadrisphaera setariae]
MSGTTWVLGGGSGIGRACALSLAAASDLVVVSGRRADHLEETAAAVAATGCPALALPLDVTDDDAVARAGAAVEDRGGPVARLVYSAGTNTPRRAWSQLSGTAFAGVVDTNLTGVVRAASAVLPGMRSRGGGHVVLVSSWAGWTFSPGAGAAYSASKTAMGSLAETLNQQERHHGVRATHLCPGEVATDILRTRPVPPTDAETSLMLAPEDVASAVAWVCSQPGRVCVNELVITPTANASYAAPVPVPAGAR